MRVLVFFFNDTATTEIYTLSLHDALPIWEDPITWRVPEGLRSGAYALRVSARGREDQIPFFVLPPRGTATAKIAVRSEEHTSELQSRQYLVCRLLLEKKKKTTQTYSLILQ